jgi:hypothetical protein
MKQFLIFLFIGLIIETHAQAQDSTFFFLDKSNAKSGILLDPLTIRDSLIQRCDGVNKAILKHKDYRNINLAMKRACFDNTVYKSNSQIDSLSRELHKKYLLQGNNAYPLFVTIAEYNTIEKGALTNGNVTIEKGKYYNTNAASNVIETKKLVMATMPPNAEFERIINLVWSDESFIVKRNNPYDRNRCCRRSWF